MADSMSVDPRASSAGPEPPTASQSGEASSSQALVPMTLTDDTGNQHKRMVLPIVKKLVSDRQQLQELVQTFSSLSDAEQAIVPYRNQIAPTVNDLSIEISHVMNKLIHKQSVNENSLHELSLYARQIKDVLLQQSFAMQRSSLQNEEQFRQQQHSLQELWVNSIDMAQRLNDRFARQDTHNELMLSNQSELVQRILSTESTLNHQIKQYCDGIKAEPQSQTDQALKKTIANVGLGFAGKNNETPRLLNILNGHCERSNTPVTKSGTISKANLRPWPWNLAPIVPVSG